MTDQDASKKFATILPGAMTGNDMTDKELKLSTPMILLAQLAIFSGAAMADDLPFSVTRMSVCDYAVDRSEVNKSLRSLYSCKHNMIIIVNVSGKTLAFEKVVINQNKCKNHLFLNGEPKGPLKAGDKITFATSCNVSRLDMKIGREDFYYLF